MKKSLIIVLLLLITITLNASQTTLVPFFGFATYEDATKNSDMQAGVYANIEDDGNNYELLFEHKTISYDTTKSNTNQNNVAFIYSFVPYNSLKVRAGTHYIKSSDESSNNILVGLLGIEKNNNRMLIGVDLSVSKYNDNALTNYTHQVTPHIGFNFGHPNSVMGKFYTKLIYDIVYINGSNQTLQDSYSSYTIRLEKKSKHFDNTLQYWFGEQLYSVRNNGLTIYNLGDIHSGGIIFSTKYKYDKEKNFKFSFINEDFKTFGVTTQSNLNRFLFSANFSL